MQARQKQLVDSLVRIRAFIEAHPVSGPMAYGAALTTLDEALQRCRNDGATQLSSRSTDRGAQAEQEQLRRRLRDRHMRPIVTIARAHAEPGSDVGLPAAFRMPRTDRGLVETLQGCDAMIAAARQHEALLIAEGLPADFLARFIQARDALAATADHRAVLRGTQIGATAGIAVALRRARRAIDRLDAIVRVAYEGDEIALATWRRVKRVHLLPERGERGVEAEEPTPVIALSPESPTAEMPTLDRAA